MLALKFDIQGLTAALGDLRKIPAAARAGCKAGIVNAVEFIATETRNFISKGGEGWAPLKEGGPATLNRTGGLLGSIMAIPGGGMSASVVVGAPYAVYHEMGTGRMPARPFLWPTVAKCMPEAAAIVKAAVIASIGGIGFAGSRGGINRVLTLAEQGKGFFGGAAKAPAIYGKISDMRERFRLQGAPPKGMYGNWAKRTWPEVMR